jgi:hypothetical protein
MIKSAASALLVISFASIAVGEEPVWRTESGNTEIPAASAGLAPALPQPTGTCTAADWNGTWYSIYGVLELKGSVTGIEGSYEYLNGHIAGTLEADGCRLVGRWDQDPSHADPQDVGPFTFVLSADRRKWSGNWGFDADPDYIGSWDAARDAADIE